MDNLFGFVTRGEFDKLKKAHEHGADIHFNDDWLLEGVGYYGQLDIAKYLIENGAKVNSVGGRAGLILSGVRCHTEVNKYLCNIYNIELRKDKILKLKDRIKIKN